MTKQRTPPLARQNSSSASSSTDSSNNSTLSAPSHIPPNYNTTRYISFTSAILSCLCAGSLTAYSLYGHLFQERLHYTQRQVNLVIIFAELAIYLPVSLLGYVCDRAGPARLSFFSAILFGGGYLLAAFTYRSGRDELTGYTHTRGWPVWVMILAFIMIGVGTTSMYISAVTSVAKDFGKGKYRGLALACPIAAFGLSGMWQSQIGSRVLYERLPGRGRGDVDVFQFFVFLGVTLCVVGLLGTFLLKVVGEEVLIEEAAEGLERSGLLQDSESRSRGYGAIEETPNAGTEVQSVNQAKCRDENDLRKKDVLLNEETRQYLKDHTMWLTAAGFFFVSGPGEAFIANLGTIIGTLSPPSSHATTSPATHVSIVAAASTIARIIAGTLTDILAPLPSTTHLQLASAPVSRTHPRPSTTTDCQFPYHSKPRSFRLRLPNVSRVAFLITAGFLLSLGEVILASGFCQSHPSRFWLVSLLHGAGYGTIFSLTPLLITVIWGVENFGTNWGIVAMMPAFGNTLWGLVYSGVYQAGAVEEGMGNKAAEVLCYGKQCYDRSFWPMAVSVWVGCGLWCYAWLGPGGWRRRGIAV